MSDALGQARGDEKGRLGKAELDLHSLIWTQGAAFPLASLESRLKCPLCGSRRVAVIFDVPSEPAAMRIAGMLSSWMRSLPSLPVMEVASGKPQSFSPRYRAKRMPVGTSGRRKSCVSANI